MTVFCVLPHREGETAQPEPQTLVCASHTRRLLKLIDDVRANWLDTALIIEPGSAPKEASPKTRHMKSSSPPAPINLDVAVLRDPRSSSVELPGDTSRPVPSILSIVASWVILVAEERPITTVLPSSVVAQLDLLHRHGLWITAQPWVDDFWLELTELNKALRSALRDQTHQFIGRCYLPAEDKPCNGSLLRANGTERVQCQRCREVWSTPQQLARLELALNEGKTA